MPKNPKVPELLKAGKRKTLPINQVTVPSYHDRTDTDEETLEKLASNMSEVGQINPIIVEKVSDVNYELISGLRRLSAAKKLDWEEIDAIILEKLDDEGRMLIMISENAQRQDVNDYDLVVSLVHFVAASTDKTDDEIKAFLYKLRNFDSGNVKYLSFEEKKLRKAIEDAMSRTDKFTLKALIAKLKVLNFHDDIVKAMQDKKLLFSYALQLNKVKDPEKMKDLLDRFTTNQISKDELKKEIREIVGENKKVIPFEETLKKLRFYPELPEVKQKAVTDKMSEVEQILAS